MTQRTTVIGANMRVDGSVAGDGNVIVRGHLEGAVHIGGTLTVAPGAIVRADVVAGLVLVEGCLEGKVRSAGPVRVTSRGVLSGEVQGDIEVEPGGVHRGALRRRGPGASTDFSSEMPGGRNEPGEYSTDPLAVTVPPPGASKASLRLSGPPPASDPEPETVRWYGEAGLSRMNEPPRRESGPIPFAITTGEPRSVASETGLPTVPGLAKAPAPWTSTSHETPTAPRDPEARTDPGIGRPLKLSATDLVGDDSPPPQLGMDTSDSPLPMPGVGDGAPSSSPRGGAEPSTPNPPVRRTTSPGVSPIRRTFGQNTARHRLDGEQDDA